MANLLQLFSPLVAFICLSSADQFNPDRSDYDLFGVKVTGNSLMIAQADNRYSLFIVQFAPYTDDPIQTFERGCEVHYEYSSWFVYTVALGKHQSTYQLFFVGEETGLEETSRLNNRTFVGVLTYTGSPTEVDCDSFTTSVQYVPIAFPHQEYLVMVIDPHGSIGYGYSDLFTFSYRVSTDNLTVHQNHPLSPSRSFLPFAADYDGSHGIAVGLLDNGPNLCM